MEEKPREFATITDAIVAKSIAYATGVHVSDVHLISFEESEGSVLGTEPSLSSKLIKCTSLT